jgi:hypothetical protein
LVVEELARAKGLWKRVDELFTPPGSGRGYKASEYVKPLVWLLTAGGRSLEHIRELKAEQEVLKELGMQRLPDAGTFGDWLRRHSRQRGLKAIAQVNEEVIADYVRGQGEELVLDADATIIEAEKREAQWTYKGTQGYHPMLAYVNEACVHHEFREGNESPGGRAMEFLTACEAKLPGGKKIYLRSDSAYYQGDVIKHYSKPGRTFSITADQDSAVKAAMKAIREEEWKKLYDKEGVATDREIAETVHCMNNMKESFRLIVVRWANPQPDLFERERYCYHAIASNRPQGESATEVLHRHNQHCESENHHKELKCGYSMEQMPCGDTQANALYFGIGVLAYNLGVVLKAEVLPEEYRTSTVATLRWKIYRLAGKLVRHGRRYALKVKTDAEKFAMLTLARERCWRLSG